METTKSYPSIGQALILLVLLSVLLLGGHIAASIISAIAGSLLAPNSPVLTLIDIVAYGAALLWGFGKTKKSFREVFSFSSSRITLLIPLMPILIGFGIISSEVDNITRWFFPMPEFIAEALADLMGGSIIALMMLAVIAPANEELLFRGLILRGFLSRYTVRKAVLASAIIFALFHINPYQFFTAFFTGVFLAWLFLQTRSLWPCIAAHALYNLHLWVVNNVLTIDIPGYRGGAEALLASHAVEFQPLWFDALGLLLLGIGLAFLRTQVTIFRIHQMPQ